MITIDGKKYKTMGYKVPVVGERFIACGCNGDTVIITWHRQDPYEIRRLVIEEVRVIETRGDMITWADANKNAIVEHESYVCSAKALRYDDKCLSNYYLVTEVNQDGVITDRKELLGMEW